MRVGSRNNLFLKCSNVVNKSETSCSDPAEGGEGTVPILNPVGRGRSNSMTNCFELRHAERWRGQTTEVAPFATKVFFPPESVFNEFLWKESTRCAVSRIGVRWGMFPRSC